MFQVQFEVCDATKCKYAAGTFDVIYSRDTILHIDDKRDLFAKFLVSLFASYSVVRSVILALVINRYLVDDNSSTLIRSEWTGKNGRKHSPAWLSLCKNGSDLQHDLCGPRPRLVCKMVIKTMHCDALIVCHVTSVGHWKSQVFSVSKIYWIILVLALF